MTYNIEYSEKDGYDPTARMVAFTPDCRDGEISPTAMHESGGHRP